MSVTPRCEWQRPRQVDPSQISLKLERVTTLTLIFSAAPSQRTASLTFNLIKMLVKETACAMALSLNLPTLFSPHGLEGKLRVAVDGKDEDEDVSPCGHLHPVLIAEL